MLSVRNLRSPMLLSFGFILAFSCVLAELVPDTCLTADVAVWAALTGVGLSVVTVGVLL
jgi:hypothetical protein